MRPFSIPSRTRRVLVGAAILAYASAWGRAADLLDVASDFATEVVAYVQGVGIPRDWLTGELFNNPTSALGRPTIDTTGDGFNTGPPSQAVPVVIVNPPLRYFEMVPIGEGGELIVKLGRPAIDDPQNPCGIDLIIFGNTFQIIDQSEPWRNGDPNLVAVGTTLLSNECGRVSVSQTGPPAAFDWRTFDSGPFADDFAPTLGRQYDPACPDPSLGSWNHWWGSPTDPRVPLKPALRPAHTAGLSVADCARLYGVSAGGTGFDLADVGLNWCLYVRIENPVGSGVSPEIDAVAVVDAAVAPPDPDLDCDLDVDGVDLDRFLGCLTGADQAQTRADCRAADLDGDGDVDLSDFGLFQRCLTGPDRPAMPGCWEPR